jgi:hypothetical protein
LVRLYFEISAFLEYHMGIGVDGVDGVGVDVGVEGVDVVDGVDVDVDSVDDADDLDASLGEEE